MSALSEKKVLVVAPAWVGDMVLSQSLYKVLNGRGAEVHVMAPASSRELLARMPEVEMTLAVPATHGELKLGARYVSARRLRGLRHDRAIVLPRSLKSALMPWFMRIPVRTGYLGEMRYGVLNDIRRLGDNPPARMVDRYVNLAPLRGESLSFDAPSPALTVDVANLEACVEKFELDLQRAVVAMMPGAAYGPSKQWPTAYFADMARRYVNDGSQVWVLGSRADAVAGETIAAKGGKRVRNLCGQTKLIDTVDLLSLADHAVTNDSGLMHVAAAVGCPVVAMYGATPIDYTPPMTDASKCMSHPIECRPCRRKECRYGHYQCLTEIKPDVVFREAQALRRGA